MGSDAAQRERCNKSWDLHVDGGFTRLVSLKSR